MQVLRLTIEYIPYFSFNHHISHHPVFGIPPHMVPHLKLKPGPLHSLHQLPAKVELRRQLHNRNLNKHVYSRVQGGQTLRPVQATGSIDRTRFYAELEVHMKDIEMWSARQERLYPDTVEALSKLAEENIDMGLVTNTSRNAAEYVLRALGLEKFFSLVLTRNDVPRLKPHPVMIQLAMARMEGTVGWLIGDTVYDAEAAADSKLKSILIRRNGVRPSFGHDYFVNSLSDVLSIVL